ncbi:MAG: hypothetical protein OEV06_12560, partial [Anaerolineae bacterium]|nr:hypothetical protein [Anaerolineae bacterium]
LMEGPNSRNSDLVGFALEGQIYANNSVLIESSTIVSDLPGSRLYRGTVVPVIRGNTLIAVEWPGENKYYTDRASAGWPDYPDFLVD